MFTPKNSPQFAPVLGTPLLKKSHKPKSEIQDFSQPRRALRRFHATMSAHTSNFSMFLCVNLWCQVYFQNLFVEVYHRMGQQSNRATEVIMAWPLLLQSMPEIVCVKCLMETNPQGPSWELGSAKVGSVWSVSYPLSGAHY